MMSTKGAHSATVMSSRPSPRRAGVPPNARESRLLISSSSRNGFHSDSSFIGFHRVNALIKLFLSILRRKFTCPRPRWPPSFTSGGPASNSSRTAFRFSQNPCQGQQGDASSSHLHICLKTGFVCFNKRRANLTHRCVNPTKCRTANADSSSKATLTRASRCATKARSASTSATTTLPQPYPVFQVTAITHRKDGVYPAIIVGFRWTAALSIISRTRLWSV